MKQIRQSDKSVEVGDDALTTHGVYGKVVRVPAWWDHLFGYPHFRTRNEGGERVVRSG